jgi:hypothetical protein
MKPPNPPPPKRAGKVEPVTVWATEMTIANTAARRYREDDPAVAYPWGGGEDVSPVRKWLIVDPRFYDVTPKAQPQPPRAKGRKKPLPARTEEA